MRVGAVVLNYRGADDTVACLESLATLADPPRVIVVDNNSGDGSVERIRSSRPDLELIANDDNVGFAGGNNVAIERLLADGAEFVWLLNNDTTVEPDTLDAMLAAAATDDRLGAVGSVIYDMSRPERVLTWGGGSVSRWTGRTRDASSAVDRIDYLTGASMLLRSAALRDVGLFDTRFFFTWEDVDLGVRLGDAGWRIAVAEGSRVWHRWGGSIGSDAPLRLEHHASGLVVFMRKHSRLPWLTSLPLLVYYALVAVRQRHVATWSAAWRGWRRGWSA
jgi:GT2 family glycosyltransferase